MTSCQTVRITKGEKSEQAGGDPTTKNLDDDPDPWIWDRRGNGRSMKRERRNGSLWLNERRERVDE